MPATFTTTACRGPEEAKRKQDLIELGRHSTEPQEAHRHLHHALRVVVKTTGQAHADIKPETQQYLQKVYDNHKERFNYQMHEAFKTGIIGKYLYQAKAMLELQ